MLHGNLYCGTVDVFFYADETYDVYMMFIFPSSSRDFAAPLSNAWAFKKWRIILMGKDDTKIGKGESVDLAKIA